MTLDKILEKRCSIRKYNDDNLKDEEIKEILNAANKAPIGLNRYDHYHLTVITNKQFINAIQVEAHKKVTSNKESLFNAPCVIIVSSDIYEDITYADCACIIENMILKASELEIGSCYIWGIINKLKDGEYIKALNLKEGFRPISAVVLGKTDEKLKSKDKEIPVNYIK
ncbi:MAG: nitroreductase family protein [Tissierellia bacterium]|nr:nitroreductase family protein [Tissierellia bacterium]